MKTKLIAVYVLCACITFGHAWHRIGKDFKPQDKDGVLYFSLCSAAVWPLYWSTVFWEGGDV